MTSNLNVYQRFSLACSVIDGQPWVLDLENKQYKSIPIDSMRAGVRKACVKAGLIHVGPYDIEYEHTVTDGRTHRYLGTCKFAYINTDNPEERIEFESMGEAMDNGDKGVGKFITNCIKNHYKSVFDIGEQNEDDLDSYSNGEFEAETKKLKEQESGFAKAKECRKAIEAWIDDDPEKNTTHEIIATYAKQYGVLGAWKAGTVIQCYKELRDAKVNGLTEVKI